MRTPDTARFSDSIHPFFRQVAAHLMPKPARKPNFAQARQFINSLPAECDPNLAQCAAHLKDLLDFADRVQSQKAIGYASKDALAALAKAPDGIGMSIRKQPLGDDAPIFTEPTASLGLLAAVSGYAGKWLKEELDNPGMCANVEHHKDVRDLFEVIELERAK